MTNHKRIPTSTRLLITLVTDRCLDVNLAGKHWAYQYTFTGEISSGQYLGFRVVTIPAGGKHTDPEAQTFEADLDDLWKDDLPFIADGGAKEGVERQLTAMLTHLDGLLIGSMSEGPALKAVK